MANIDDLHPTVAQFCRWHIDFCLLDGITLLVTSTYRSHEEQAALYEIGRTKPGHIITNARPGRSWHNWRLAYDVVPLIHGKPSWHDTALWERVGQIGEDIGLEWGGRWKKFVDMPHFQYTWHGLYTLDNLTSGEKVLPAE